MLPQVEPETPAPDPAPRPVVPAPTPPAPPATSGVIAFNVEVVHIGESYNVDGSGFNAGDEVKVIALYDADLEFDATADADGRFKGSFRATRAGTIKHEVRVDGFAVTSEVLKVEEN